MSSRDAALLVALAFVLAPLSSAQARVALVAGGTPELVLLNVTTDRVVTRLALPAASTAVAVDGDGVRGFVAAGSTVIAIDVNQRTETVRRALGGTAIAGLVVSPDGHRLFAVHGRRLRVLRALSLIHI